MITSKKDGSEYTIENNTHGMETSQNVSGDKVVIL